MPARLRPTLTGALLAALALAAPASAASHGTAVSIVELDAAPLASYAGGTEGIPATAPRATRGPLDAGSSAATRYRAYLGRRQAALLAALPGTTPDVLYSYRNALAGFAAVLTSAQVTALEATPGVAAVSPAENDALDSADDDLGGSDPTKPWLGGDGAAWLRLTAPGSGPTSVPGGGLWSRIGGGPTAADGPGDGTVIGDLDTGLVTVNQSFAATPGATGGYLGAPFGAAPASWHGSCDPTFPACSNKVLGARMFSAGILAAGVTLNSDESPLSPIDHEGHGSHTASTAVGNYGVPIYGAAGGPRISGMAPRARLAVYKVCWNQGVNPETSTCNSADVIAAIDAGLADGVNVLTHSIGGGVSQGSPKQRAFLRAYDAGVFVSASAGNDGPAVASYGATPSPWTTVVAATTLNRAFAGRVTLSRPGSADVVVDGTSLGGQLSTPTELVDAKTIPAMGQTADNARLCMANALSTAAAGKVVFCERGTNDRVAKSAEVKRAGGVAMILANPSTSPNDTDPDFHAVPTVHVNNAGFTTIRSAIMASSVPLKATLKSSTTAAVPADGATSRVADFSSRGPVSTATDLPGPDVAGPGVDVLAALKGDNTFGLLSGTSMATPHVAGAALLLEQRHPLWTPEAIKSALATTADPNVLNPTGTGATGPQAVGSGEIVPNAADTPGLVVTPTRASLSAYGDSPSETAGDLNLPAVVAWTMGGSEHVVRRFTSVDAVAHTWTISGTAPGGAATTLATTPALGQTVTVRPCASVDVAIDLGIGNGALDTAQSGELKLTDETGRTVRLPITARPTKLGAPATTTLRAQATPAVKSIAVSTGYAGAFAARSLGLATAVTSSRTVQAATTTADPTKDTNALRIPVDLPSGAAGLLALETSGGNAGSDLDAYLYARTGADTPSGTPLATSGNDGSDEQITSVRPSGGAFVWVITGYRAPAGGATFTLKLWNTADADSSSALTLGGAAATRTSTAKGDRFGLDLTASGVGAEGRYYGLIGYFDNAAGTGTPFATSIVDVKRAAALPAVAERSPSGCVDPNAPPSGPTGTTSTGTTSTGTTSTGPTPPPATDPGTGSTPTPGPPAAGAPGTPAPPTPAPAGPVGATPPPMKIPPRAVKLTVGKLTLSRRRTVVVSLSGSTPVKVSIAVFKGKAKKPATAAAAQSVSSKAKRLRFKLGRTLKRGTYRVVLTARAADGRRATVTRTVRVR